MVVEAGRLGTVLVRDEGCQWTWGEGWVVSCLKGIQEGGNKNQMIDLGLQKSLWKSY